MKLLRSIDQDIPRVLFEVTFLQINTADRAYSCWFSFISWEVYCKDDKRQILFLNSGCLSNTLAGFHVFPQIEKLLQKADL